MITLKTESRGQRPATAVPQCILLKSDSEERKRFFFFLEKGEKNNVKVKWMFSLFPFLIRLIVNNQVFFFCCSSAG